MDTASGANTSPRRTRPGNSNKWPAEILFTSGTMQKKCTKAEKVVDNQRLKAEWAAKEEATKAGIACLAMMEMEAKEKAQAAKQKMAKKAPCPPQSHSKVGGGKQSGSRAEDKGNGGEGTETKGKAPSNVSTQVAMLASMFQWLTAVHTILGQVLTNGTPSNDEPEIPIRPPTKPKATLCDLKESLQEWKANRKSELTQANRASTKQGKWCTVH